MTLAAHRSETPLSGDDLKIRLAEAHGWRLEDGKQLVREYSFSTFSATLVFVEKVSRLAEEINHHPEVCFTDRKAKVSLTTHAIRGLSDKDFMLAERIAALGSG